MSTAAQPSPGTVNPGIPYPELRRCVSLDLEVSPEDGSLLAAAVYRPDTGDSLSMSERPSAGSLQRLERVAGGAEFLLGHNVIDFDIPHLQAFNPNLSLLKMPAVDTLRLNPLAFPPPPLSSFGQALQGWRPGAQASQRPSPGQQAGCRGLRQPAQEVGRDAPGAAHRMALADQRRERCRFRPGLLCRTRGCTAHPGGGEASNPAEARRRGLPVSDAVTRRCHRGTGLASGLRPGMAVGGRHQLSHAAVGAVPVPPGPAG